MKSTSRTILVAGMGTFPAVHEGRLSELFVLLVQYAHKGGR